MDERILVKEGRRFLVATIFSLGSLTLIARTCLAHGTPDSPGNTMRWDAHLLIGLDTVLQYGVYHYS